MVTERGSITARRAAAARAIETEKPKGERMLSDPYAAAFTDEEGRAFMENLDRLFPGVHLTHVSRAWAIDEHLKQEVVAGTRQVVVLGAGYDSSPHSMEELQRTGVRVFEVDEAITSGQKQAKVKEILG